MREGLSEVVLIQLPRNTLYQILAYIMTKKQKWITSWIVASAAAATTRFLFPNAIITVITLLIIATTFVLVVKDLMRRK